MDFKKLFLVLAVCTVAFSISSCKKKEDPTLLSFGGTLSFDLPLFVEAGEKVTVTPRGALVPAGDTYGYCWTVSPVMSKSDTTKTEKDPSTVDGSFTFAVPDTLCSLEFTCRIFGNGYYSSSKSQKTTILNEEKSLSGQDFNDASGVFTDSRDGEKYPYSRIGNLEWFCRNLAYEELGVPFRLTPVTSGLFGRFYNWDEAAEACPEGWRIPTEEDWLELAKFFDSSSSASALETFSGLAGHMLSNAILNGEKDSLWEFWPKVKVTNEKSLNVLPSGYCYKSGDNYTFTGFGDYAAFWTSTAHGDDQAIYRYLNEGDPDMHASAADKNSFYATVRCVRDVNTSDQ